MNFKDKIIVVTGAGGGVGRQLVIQLLQKGALVAAVDINEDAVVQTKRQAGPKADRVSIHNVDITDINAVTHLPTEIKTVHGHIDGLINNAGIIQPFITIADLDNDVIERMMNINFYGMLNLTRAFVPHLAERPVACIGNVSSMGGFLAVPGQSIYGASKAAVKIATEGLRMELSQTNIGVSLIIPGGIETDIKKNSGLREEGNAKNKKKAAGIKLTSPEKAAQIILKGIEKNKAKILVGSDAVLMDILYRAMPIKAGKLISRIMSQNHGGIMNRSEELMMTQLNSVKPQSAIT